MKTLCSVSVVKLNYPVTIARRQQKASRMHTGHKGTLAFNIEKHAMKLCVWTSAPNFPSTRFVCYKCETALKRTEWV